MGCRPGGVRLNARDCPGSQGSKYQPLAARVEHPTQVPANRRGLPSTEARPRKTQLRDPNSGRSNGSAATRAGRRVILRNQDFSLSLEFVGEPGSGALSLQSIDSKDIPRLNFGRARWLILCSYGASGEHRRMTRRDGDAGRQFPWALDAPGGTPTPTDGDLARVHSYSVVAWFLWMLTVLSVTVLDRL
jgi:hypothetical protein